MKIILKLLGLIAALLVININSNNVYAAECGANDELHIYENNVRITDNSVYVLTTQDNETCLTECHYGDCPIYAAADEEKITFYKNSSKQSIFKYGGIRCLTDINDFSDLNKISLYLYYPLSDLQNMGSVVIPARKKVEQITKYCVSGPIREFNVDIAQGKILEMHNKWNNILLISASVFLLFAIAVIFYIKFRKRRKRKI